MKYQENWWFICAGIVFIGVNCIIQFADGQRIFAVGDLILGGSLIWSTIHAKKKTVKQS
jgi:hypothetical protein